MIIKRKSVNNHIHKLEIDDFVKWANHNKKNKHIYYKKFYHEFFIENNNIKLDGINTYINNNNKISEEFNGGIYINDIKKISLTTLKEYNKILDKILNYTKNL